MWQIHEKMLSKLKHKMDSVANIVNVDNSRKTRMLNICDSSGAIHKLTKMAILAWQASLCENKKSSNKMLPTE